MNDTASTLWVFYDGTCGMCSRSVAWALARDRNGVLRAEPAQSPEAALRLGTRAGETLGSLHVWSQDSGVLKGSEAIAALLARLPGWGWAATLLRARLIRPLARLAYAAIAAHRHRFGPATCALPEPTGPTKR